MGASEVRPEASCRTCGRRRLRMVQPNETNVKTSNLECKKNLLLGYDDQTFDPCSPGRDTTKICDS
jgi:hypothetical protein